LLFSYGAVAAHPLQYPRIRQREQARFLLMAPL